MSHQLPWREDFDQILETVNEEAKKYLAQIDSLPAKPAGAHENALAVNQNSPELGMGAKDALQELVQMIRSSAVHTAGPRCFHFVIGGSTPASLGGDWLASLYDQLAYAWVSSPIAVQLELISLQWLAEWFGIPKSYGMVMTTGATMSNFVGLAAGRQWVGKQLGIDVAQDGMSSLSPIPVFASGHIHASSLKALGMLGIGRGNVKKLVKDGTGDLALELLEDNLKKLQGKPAIIMATVGEPNAGRFDPLPRMMDLAEKYNCWLHVDGAFGLFAKLSDRTASLVSDLHRADSITVDGHKWLNVPYDCGFSFVRDKSLLIESFRYTAEYLPPENDPEPVIGAIGPESSRRARSFSVWSTLKAYGKDGYKKLINHHIDLAEYLKEKVDADEFLERLADVRINVVCFRYHPKHLNLDDGRLDELNRRIGQKILEDGRVYVGSTTYNGKVALRPAISNWRTEKGGH